MSDHLAELARVVDSLVTKLAGPPVYGELALDRRVWDEFEQLGFTNLTMPAPLGGAGGDLRDAAAVVRAAALSATPLAEANFLAAPALAAAEIGWPGGVVTAAKGLDISVSAPDGTERLHGTAIRVPWLHEADHLVLLVCNADRPAAAVIPLDAEGLAVIRGHNLAGEPRDHVTLDAVVPSGYSPLPRSYRPEDFDAFGAVARSVQMAGAAGRALTLVRRHVNERIQFGRPLARFQAVQHQVAVLASQVQTMHIAGDAAVRALCEGSPAAPVLTAAAKVETSTLARSVAAIAHQLHGAIGFTREHRLGTCTERLWSWREEYGNEVVWQERLADLVDEADGDVWGVLTNAPSNRGAATL
jgi:acyl-CoA dehydrogenase